MNIILYQGLVTVLTFFPLYIFLSVIQLSTFDVIEDRNPGIQNNTYFVVAKGFTTAIKVFGILLVSLKLAQL